MATLTKAWCRTHRGYFYHDPLPLPRARTRCDRCAASALVKSKARTRAKLKAKTLARRTALYKLRLLSEPEPEPKPGKKRTGRPPAGDPRFDDLQPPDDQSNYEKLLAQFGHLARSGE